MLVPDPAITQLERIFDRLAHRQGEPGACRERKSAHGPPEAGEEPRIGGAGDRLVTVVHVGIEGLVGVPSGCREIDGGLHHPEGELELQPEEVREAVLCREAELDRMQELARAQGLTLAAWVRQTLRAAARTQPLGDVDRKLAVIRAAARHQFPTADVDQMNAEIEAGYLAGSEDE